MNYEFLKTLDSAKTFDNASNIEALKRMYVLCECCTGERCDIDQCTCCTPEGVCIRKVDDRCVEFSCDNGSVRLTLASPSSVLVEASPTGTGEMYRVVGNVSIDTRLDDALKLGMTALADEALVESWFGDMGKKIGKGVATAALAATAASGVGCAGNANMPPVDNNVINAEYGIDAGHTVSDTVIPELVKQVSAELRKEAGNQDGDNYSVATTYAAEKAKHIYQMLQDGSIKVRNWAPEKIDQKQAQLDAAEAFARGLDKELRTSMKLDGANFLKSEVN